MVLWHDFVGNFNTASRPDVITLEDMTMSASSTTAFGFIDTDSYQLDQLILVGSVALDGMAQITFDYFTPHQPTEVDVDNPSGLAIFVSGPSPIRNAMAGRPKSTHYCSTRNVLAPSCVRLATIGASRNMLIGSLSC